MSEVKNNDQECSRLIYRSESSDEVPVISQASCAISLIRWGGPVCTIKQSYRRDADRWLNISVEISGGPIVSESHGQPKMIEKSESELLVLVLTKATA
jgi:hypothetical protein